MRRTIRWSFALLLALLLAMVVWALAETVGLAALGPGMRGDDVESLNARLALLGYLDGELSEEYGADTGAAVRAFQAAAGLEVSGVADAATRKALSAEDAPVNPDDPPAGEMVWITKTGERYHDSWICSGMQYRTCVTVEEAADQGFTPCLLCFPEESAG